MRATLHDACIATVRLQAQAKLQPDVATILSLVEHLQAEIATLDAARQSYEGVLEAASDAVRYHDMGRTDRSPIPTDPFWDANEMIARLDRLGAALNAHG